MVNSDWKVVESRFEGEKPHLIWYARIEEPGTPESRNSFDIVVCYDSAALETLYELEVSEKLASYDFMLKGKTRAQLSVWRNEILSVEAIADPPRRVLYLFLLEVAKQYRVVQRVEVVIKMRGPEGMTTTPEEERLEGNARNLLRAIREKNEPMLRQSTMVQIASWLVSTKKKLGEAEERVILQSCRAKVGNRTEGVPVIPLSSGGMILRLSAHSEDTLTLFLTVYVQSLTPYSNRFEVDEKPLPSYAFLKLDRDDGTIRYFGNPTGKAGEFQLGPAKVQNLRKLRLEAAHPLYPQGSGPSIAASILFRTGRLIERYLDEGSVPTLPALPEDLELSGVVQAVLRQAENAVDPDRGVVMGLHEGRRLELYAAGFEIIHRYPELQEILDEALAEAIAMQSWTFPQEPQLSGDTNWTERDALIVLRHPGLANQLAARMSNAYEPVLELFKTKEIVESEFEIDRQSVSPHALAAAGLAKANAQEFGPLIDSQLKHLVEVHSAKDPSSWRFSDMENVGHSMKVVFEQVHESPTKQLAGEILRGICQEAFRRFKDDHAHMSLSEKVAIAHLISPVWYPYFNLPKPMASMLERDEREVPTQRMMPGHGGRDVTGEELEDVRLLYKSAFERALKEVRTSRQSKQQKRAWMEKFLDDWHEYLFQAHKGGYLQPYEEDLRNDRARALKSIK